MIEFLNSFGTFLSDNSLLAVLIALIGGILSSFSPCMLSTLPLIIGYLALDENTQKNNKNRNVKLSLIFSFGIIITFTTLGILSVVLSKNLRIWGSFWYIIIATILLISGLQLTGIIRIKDYCKKPILKKSAAGAFFLGIFGGIFASPCSTPILVAILAYVSEKSNLIFGVILMLVYSIGFCVAIFLTGLSVDFIKKISNSDKYYKFSKILTKFLGIIILFVSFYLYYRGF